MDKFIDFVADVFEVDSSELSPDTKYGEFEIWDSLMMMRLIMEIEEEYDCIIPIENAAKIRTLKDLYQFTVK